MKTVQQPLTVKSVLYGTIEWIRVCVPQFSIQALIQHQNGPPTSLRNLNLPKVTFPVSVPKSPSPPHDVVTVLLTHNIKIWLKINCNSHTPSNNPNAPKAIGEYDIYQTLNHNSTSLHREHNNQIAGAVQTKYHYPTLLHHIYTVLQLYYYLIHYCANR